MIRLGCFIFLVFMDLAYSASCKVVYTDRAPFYISQVKDNQTDTFEMGKWTAVVNAKSQRGKDKLLTEKVYDDQFQHNGKILKRGTIVIPTHKIKNGDDDTIIEIKVLSESNSNLASILSKNPKKLLLNKNNTGYIYQKSLSSIDQSTVLVLKEDARLFKFNGDKISLDAGSGIKPIKKNGVYKVNQCKENGSVKYYYLYQAIDLNAKDTEVFQLQQSELACLPINYIEQKNYNKLGDFLRKMQFLYGKGFKFKDLEINEWGMVNLPSIITNPDTKGVVSISYDEAFVHVKGGDPLHSDTWGDPDTVCQFTEMAKDWHEYCQNKLGLSSQRCTIQVGDISWITPGKRDSGKDPLGHKHHSDGTCIDIRPLRSDDKLVGTTINFDFGGYDSNLNSKLIGFMQKYQASPIYFNDDKLIKKYAKVERGCDLKSPAKDLDQGVLSCKGHWNHIHFCFKPERVKGCN